MIFFSASSPFASKLNYLSLSFKAAIKFYWNTEMLFPFPPSLDFQSHYKITERLETKQMLCYFYFIFLHQPHREENWMLDSLRFRCNVTYPNGRLSFTPESNRIYLLLVFFLTNREPDVIHFNIDKPKLNVFSFWSVFIFGIEMLWIKLA